MTTDPILDEMANELRDVLLGQGLDPSDPPGGPPPAGRAFQEYQRRGGTIYTDADMMADALVERVKDG